MGGALGAVVCTPPYLLARAGILLLGSPGLVVLGVVLLTIGATLQAGATGAVKTVKMSAKLITPGRPVAGDDTASKVLHTRSAAAAQLEPRRRMTPDGKE